jgi:hypothetical protein
MWSVRRAFAIVALTAAAPAAAHASEPTLYVGDSLGVGTLPQLRSVDGDARIGRRSTEGLSVLRSRLRPGHETVVFDLGTNDGSPELLARNLRRTRRVTGNRLLIAFTLNRPNVRPFNDAIRRFARSVENLSVIDWHATAAREHLLAGDGIHASASGYRRRAALVTRLIRAR